MVGTLPPHPGNTLNTSWARATRPGHVGTRTHAEGVLDARLGHALSQVCGTCLGQLLHVPRMWGQCAHHPARVPGTWNMPLMRQTHSVRRTHPGHATGTCTVPGVC